MSEVIERIAVRDIQKELARRGLAATAHVRLVVEPVGDDGLPDMTAMNAASESFRFLDDEPDLYSDADLIERNV